MSHLAFFNALVLQVPLQLFGTQVYRFDLSPLMQTASQILAKTQTQDNAHHNK
jgi:hypothetical protein